MSIFEKRALAIVGVAIASLGFWQVSFFGSPASHGAKPTTHSTLAVVLHR